MTTTVPDIESKVFTTAYNALIASFPTVDMKSTPEFVKAGDLAVRLYEMDSSTFRRSMDLSRSGEHLRDVVYEVQIKSNLASGKKQQAKAVCENIHNTMISYGFRETSRRPFFEDTTYRIVARYRGRVDVSGTVS